MVMTVKPNYASASPDAVDPIQVARVLRAAGLRSTSARRAVLAALLGCVQAATAQELYARALDTGLPVSLNTVYRTLGALTRAGVIHTFARPGETAFRRCSEAPHQHLICLRCGRVDDVRGDDVERGIAFLARSAGYAVATTASTCTASARPADRRPEAPVLCPLRHRRHRRCPRRRPGVRGLVRGEPVTAVLPQAPGPWAEHRDDSPDNVGEASRRPTP